MKYFLNSKRNKLGIKYTVQVINFLAYLDQSSSNYEIILNILNGHSLINFKITL